MWLVNEVGLHLEIYVSFLPISEMRKMSTCDSLEFNNSETDAIFVLLSLNTTTLEAPRILPLLGSRTLAQEMVHESFKKENHF